MAAIREFPRIGSHRQRTPNGCGRELPQAGRSLEWRGNDEGCCARACAAAVGLAEPTRPARAAGGDERRSTHRGVRRAGYAVAICPGPAAEARCPLAGDEGCAAAAGADVVVSSLGQETAQAREALAALRERLPGRPLLIEADGNAGGRWPELLAGCELLAVGATPAQLAARIGGLLKRQAGVGA